MKNIVGQPVKPSECGLSPVHADSVDVQDINQYKGNKSNRQTDLRS